jgi:carboxypeptidase family protein
MYRCVRCTLIVGVLLIVHVSAEAQNLASIAGVVRDASGAVLPGVTVEAASPALIEKLRAVVTDATGQYRIEESNFAVWRQPTEILMARFIRLGMQFDF